MSQTDNPAVRAPEPAAHAVDWQAVAYVTLGATTLITLLLAAFTWPPSDIEPRSLPIAVAAPPDVASGIENDLVSSAGTDAFDIDAVDDRDAALAAIEDREVYGAIVAGPDQVEVLVASGASPMVAQVLTQNAQALAGETAASATVTDVVPMADGDPRGAVFNAGALPLALSGIAVGGICAVALRRTSERLIAATTVGIVGGLAIAAILQGWLVALEGSYWANASVVCLGVLAIAMPIVGLFHVMGHAGAALMAALVLLLGNPLSGVSSAPELLPLGWLGQLLPPGAVGSALRGTSYFDGAGVGLPVTVLLCWVGLGVVLGFVPRRDGAVKSV